MRSCVDIELVTDSVGARDFLFEMFHPNEFHLNVGLPAVNQKTSPHPALVPLFTV